MIIGEKLLIIGADFLYSGGMVITTGHKPTASVALVQMVLKFLEQSGLDPEAVLKTAGIPFSAVQEPDDRLDGRRFGALWLAALSMSRDPCLGLHMGEYIAASYAGGHVLFSVMKNCRTVGRALEKFFRYHCIMADTAHPKMELGKHSARLLTENGVSGPRRHLDETQLCLFASILRQLTEKKQVIREVRFQHPRPSSTAEHERIFNAPLLFNRRKSELVIERKTLDLPIFLASGELLESLERFALQLIKKMYAPRTWADRVVNALGRMIVDGERADLESVAGKLAVSKRTLQVRLQAERVTYQKLQAEVKKEIAMNCLKKAEASICDIAFLLGFSEQSAFNHAFKRWTGSTPLAYMQPKKE